MSSDEASSGVSYTSISSDYEEMSDAGSLGVIVYGYDGLPMHPVDLPSPDYVLGPKETEHGPPLPDYVPGPEYPEYFAPYDDEKEDLEDESEDGPADYPADGGNDDDDDDDDDDSSGDDAYDEEEASKEDNEEEEEEHLTLAYSTAVSSATNPVPSAKETEPFETDASAATPPPPHAYRVARLLAIPTPPPSPLTRLSSPLPHIPSPPLPVPSPPTSPTYAEAPLGYRAVKIWLRTASLPPLPSPPLPPPSSHLLLAAFLCKVMVIIILEPCIGKM
ncbi:hypothetical protein Tco_1375019 [Tanacetum coccineum]